MDLDSVAASVHQITWHYLAYSMLHVWRRTTNQAKSCKIYEGAYGGFTVENMNRILNFAIEGDTYFNPLCRIPGKEYKSDNFCAYNVADSMIAAKKFMTENISPDSNKWVWGDLHIAQWNHRIWSNVPELKPYFDRNE